jgi:hypothetical protein
MKKLYLLPFLFLGCVHSNNQVDAAGHPLLKPEVIAPNLHHGTDLVVMGNQLFLVSLTDDTGTGQILKYKKKEIQKLFNTEVPPSALAYDDRRDQVYVAQGSTVKIFEVKNPTKVISEIQFPEDLQITSMVYSIMNRRVYATVEGDGCIWEINPRKNETKVVVDSNHFSELGFGYPRQIWPTNDGSSLYVVTNESKGSDIVRVTLRNQEVKLLRKFEAETAVGIDMIKNHLIVAFSNSPYLAKYDLSRKEWSNIEIPDELLHEPLSMKLDSTVAILLDQSSLVQIPLSLKN